VWVIFRIPSYPFGEITHPLRAAKISRVNNHIWEFSDSPNPILNPVHVHRSISNKPIIAILSGRR